MQSTIMKINFTSLLIVGLFFLLPQNFVNASEGTAIKGMVFLKGDCFVMGSEESAAEEPPHQVCLSSFYIGIHEVTQEAFKKVMETNPSLLKAVNHPVENVTWPDADQYCRKQGWRLPTEAEWEYAARGKSESAYSWGADMDGDAGWYKGNSDHKHHPVGGKNPNAFGLHDMSGNVWEWVSDWYREDTYELNAKTEPFQNPLGATSGQFIIIRGGSYQDDAFFLRSAERYWYEPLVKSGNLGFRCAANPPEEKQ